MDTVEHRRGNTHHGHAIKRLRQALGIKQEKIAMEIGVCQQTISAYEQRAEIDDETLEKIAKSLGISIQLIKELEVDPVTIIFENNNTIESNTGNATIGNYILEDHSSHIYNPIEKILELFEKLLKAEQEKIDILEKLLNKK